jgi:hypothetical protein
VFTSIIIIIVLKKIFVKKNIDNLEIFYFYISN